MKKETRVLEIKELRTSGPDDEQSGGIGKIEGYAAVFNKWSDNLDFFREKIAPGAFAEAILKSDCRALMNHDVNMVLGRQAAGTLRLKEDKTGLFMTVDLPDTQYAKDLQMLIARGDITQQSFGFTVRKDAWEEDREKKEVTRTILEIDRLYDVSPVTFPAYPDTSVEARIIFDAAISDKKIAGRSDQAKTDRRLKRFAHELKMKQKLMKI